MQKRIAYDGWAFECDDAATQKASSPFDAHYWGDEAFEGSASPARLQVLTHRQAEFGGDAAVVCSRVLNERSLELRVNGGGEERALSLVNGCGHTEMVAVEFAQSVERFGAMGLYEFVAGYLNAAALRLSPTDAASVGIVAAREPACVGADSAPVSPLSRVACCGGDGLRQSTAQAG